MGGGVWIEAAGDTGARFVFWLPRAAAVDVLEEPSEGDRALD
jgi:signal transduction histidine kinase